MAQKDDKTDFDSVGDNIAGCFSSVGDSLSALVDDKKTAGEKASGAVDGLVSASSSAIKATWSLGKFAVKSTPTVIVAVAEAKRGLIDTVSEAINEARKKNLDNELDTKIKILANKNAKRD